MSRIVELVARFAARRRVVAKRRKQVVELVEPELHDELDRPLDSPLARFGKLCPRCAGMSWRVRGDVCTVCGLKHANEPREMNWPRTASGLASAQDWAIGDVGIIAGIDAEETTEGRRKTAMARGQHIKRSKRLQQHMADHDEGPDGRCATCGAACVDGDCAWDDCPSHEEVKSNAKTA